MVMKPAGEAAVETLKVHDVDTVFTLSGGHLFPLYDGCVKLDVALVDTRHEQTAAYMALGAALTEFVVLLIPAFAANWGRKAPSKAKQARGWSAFFLERSVAIASHLSSRALLWLGIGGNAGFKAVASALALFATAEAIQAYAQAKEWDWLNRRTLLTFVAFQALCIFAQLTLFVFWRA